MMMMKKKKKQDEGEKEDLYEVCLPYRIEESRNYYYYDCPGLWLGLVFLVAGSTKTMKRLQYQENLFPSFLMAKA